MAKERSSSVRRPVDTSLSNSFSSSAASSLSSSNYGVKTIRVFKNGDPYHQGTKVVLNRRYVHDLEGLLTSLSEKFDLTYGVKRLYTTDGKLIRHFQEIEDKQDYVAATNHFIPLFYGKWTNPVGHPFRGVSPVNMPQPRASRSQTRTSESKHTVKKRSQSGVTAASAATSRAGASPALVANGNKSATPDGKKKKKKVVKKKKKTEEAPTAQPEVVPEDTKAEEKAEAANQQAAEETKPESPAKPETPEQPGTPKSDRAETPTKSPSPENGDDKKSDKENSENEEEGNRTPTPSGSEHSENEHEEGGTESEAEKSSSPEPKPTPKPNGNERRPSTGQSKKAESAKGPETEKESNA